MPDPTYNPTVWISGGPPGIDAPELNNIEGGIVLALETANEASHNAITQSFLQMGS